VKALLGFVLLLIAATVTGLVFGSVYGAGEGLLMGAFTLACGTPVMVAVHVLARRRRLAASLARQLTIGIAVTVGLVTVGVACAGLLMVISPHDALTTTELLVFAGALIAYCTWVFARDAIADVESVRDGLRAVGEGRRDVRIESRGRDELAQLAESANRMTAQLREREVERDAADSARRGLVAAVSHDLRTPLTSLRLLAEAVEDGVVDPQTRARYLEQMSVHIGSLSALIDDLFELSRLEAGEIEWSMQRVRLDELLHETVEAMRVEADAKRVAVEVSTPGQLAPARGNPEKLQRVLFNLIQNAIRHTPADGSVTVAAVSNGTTLEVEVADSGEGLDPGDHERVFEPFYRGRNGDSRSGDGSGLGLTICRAIVEAHGGEITLASSSSGTRVTFSVPKLA
jgi:signal transduction histidine kinase